MEFNEKLQTLRKNKGLTQEELSEVLFVSRTAVSKWESGRGLPSVDSLKDISAFFSVSIDDLLSGEKILSIAEQESKSNMRKLCNSLFGMVDLFWIMLVVLPLYPNTIDNFVYSVNLFHYSETSGFNLILYWILFASLFAMGILKIILTKTKAEKAEKITTAISITVNIFTVFFLALTKEVYAVIIAFLLLLIKGFLILKSERTERKA